MGISSIQCTWPFCGKPKEQTNFSRNFRITAVALGVILLIAAALILSGALSCHPAIGYVCGLIGLIALAVGGCVRCVKENQNVTGGEQSNQQTHAAVNVSHVQDRPVNSHNPAQFSNTSQPQPLFQFPFPLHNQGQPQRPPLPPTPPQILNVVEVNNAQFITLPLESMIVAQPVIEMPQLTQLQNDLVSCVTHLNKFQNFLNKSGVSTQTLYDGNQFHNYLGAGLLNLPHPLLLGSAQSNFLIKWKELIESIEKAKEDLISAWLKKIKETNGAKVSDLDPDSELLFLGNNLSKSLSLLRYCLAEGFYVCNLKNEAFEQIKKVGYKDLQEIFCFKLARDCYLAGERSNVVKVLNTIHGHPQEKENFFYKLAVDYYQAGDRENAINMIQKLHYDHEKRENFFYKLAVDDLQAGDRENAINMMNYLYHDHEKKENFFYKLAFDYYQAGDKKKAIEMINKIYRNVELKENFFFLLAENYCKEGNKEMALNMLTGISRDTKRKESFLKKHQIS
jgi:tetratricopeptide (TPR) repeat protein